MDPRSSLLARLQVVASTSASGRQLISVGLALLLAVTMLPGSAGPARAANGSILMSAGALGSLPTSGSAWSKLVQVADEALGTPDLCDQDSKHAVRTLGVALVAGRTESATYRTKARNAVMAAIGTLRPGCSNAILSLGRQLGAYVLAADLIDLSGSDDSTFRAFLTSVRTQDLGGHSVWRTLAGTHENSTNNWGTFAGASRIAASAYLGDGADLGRAATVLRGFLGDRGAYAGFRGQISDTLYADEETWACDPSQGGFRPINGACTKSGINLDGSIVGDIYRGGPLRSPAADPGIPYTVEALQGLTLQTELLARNGYGDAWSWSGSALRRAAEFVNRDAAAGGTGWNHSSVATHVPWLLNARFGLSLPTVAAGYGRVFGYTDWLYGGGSAPDPGSTPPIAAIPTVGLYRTTNVASTSIAARVRWEAGQAQAGVRRYELQVAVGNRGFASVPLASALTRSRGVALSPGTRYRFRVRIVDRAGGVSGWAYAPAVVAARRQESARSIAWSAGWRRVAASSYLGGASRATKAAGVTATFRFDGPSIAWVGPVGPTRGKAIVEIDGVAVATVDLYARTFRARKVVFAASLTDAPHTIRIRALGTARRPTVALDAFHVIGTP